MKNEKHSCEAALTRIGYQCTDPIDSTSSSSCFHSRKKVSISPSTDSEEWKTADLSININDASKPGIDIRRDQIADLDFAWIVSRDVDKMSSCSSKGLRNRDEESLEESEMQRM